MSAEVIVIGTGPAGVSAAWPLLDAGCSVTIVDAGATIPPAPVPSRPPMSALRRSPTPQWDHLLRQDRSALVSRDGVSPKLRTAAPLGFGDGWAAANGIETRGFRAIGALAPGGLSTVWGAAAIAYTDADLREWPLRAADLAPSYRAVAARIGISGSHDDPLAIHHGADLPLQPPLPLGQIARHLLESWQRSRHPRPEVTLGRARNAVLTRDLAGRSACCLDNACMWGCAHGAIYASHQELPALARAGARIQTDFIVEALRPGDGGAWRVQGRDSEGRSLTLQADAVVLAAGALPSTRLALDAIGRIDSPQPLLNTPACAFALLLPGLLGTALPEKQFGLAQLAFRVAGNRGTDFEGYGTLFAADGVSAADLVEAMPLTRPGAAALTRLLMPALMIGLHYLPSDFSASSVVLRRDGAGRTRLVVSGGTRPEADPCHRAALRALARAVRPTAWLLPGSRRNYEPGAEVHIGGTLPLGGPVTPEGELSGAPGIYLADAATFPRIPAKHHTFTIMANADRIARGLGVRYGTSFRSR